MRTLPFYSRKSGFTAVGAHAENIRRLPGEVAALSAVAQGVLIHEHLAESYGVTLADEDRAPVHLRAAADLIDRILAVDPRPLEVAREPAARVAANCRQFTVLVVAMLREHGVPARARCGFGTYFGGEIVEDHWVVEYWLDGRWRLADAQIDDHQRELFGIDLDLTDVPRDRFVVAGAAWAACRAGTADPNRFGLSITGEVGYWWIAGNLVRDLAALNNVEMLPWDAWGVMPGPDDRIDEERVALFDQLAELTTAPDDHVDALRRRYDTDERLRVGPTVHNVLRSRNERISLDFAGA
ncbi:transglutaminase [Actinophytocola xinjiangensis]|uniref:Transglutaminase n=1 Tax=Actinophytocola xinjiangensis TaxID=485602 RepID=A0A7Z0WQF7_9PSEU|nr:transglutaminase-like domain-containing protein [Actinophytocola xinjiangensis]OLF13033.1 transglutaminase [Actinophytocola xinjiangensis]